MVDVLLPRCRPLHDTKALNLDTKEGHERHVPDYIFSSTEIFSL